LTHLYRLWPFKTSTRTAGAPLVLFDGDCGLCQRSIRLIARFDRHGCFRFAPLEGPTATRALAGTTIDASSRQTVVLVEGDRVATKSTAALRIAARLGWPMRALAMLWLLPRPVRDALYDLIARHRYRWFGRADTCRLPPAQLRGRLLP
jgi:predicted DCC family thiol-disulfide oxidoreductase YuxK